MTTNFYTLRALVSEWRDVLRGALVGEVFSQHAGELTLAYGSASSEGMIRLSTRAPDHFIFRVDGFSKPRRNVAAVFPSISGLEIVDIRIADRDRVVFVDLVDGLTLQIMLFGPRANVLVVDRNGRIEDAFRQSSTLIDTEAPGPRPAPEIRSLQELGERWRRDRKSVVHALSTAFPLFDSLLAREAAFRADVAPDRSPELDQSELSALLAAAREIESDIRKPGGRIYWREKRPEAFSILPLGHLKGLREERFASIDEAVRVFVRRYLSAKRFAGIYDPLEKALNSVAERYRNSLERMLEELSLPSRADRYEKWGHLLMAGGNTRLAHGESIEVDDLFDGGRISIPIDSSISSIENAQRYYEKARRTRRAREEAERRLVTIEALADEAATLLERLRSIDGLRDLDSFRTEESASLARILPDDPGSTNRVPFRRFVLAEGYEVWVGRNARQNDELTFRHAQKHDLWMHARGVPGSHVVLRLPNRNARPGRHILETAAAIAAYFSKARGSGLVPVTVAPRKHVRKAKGGDPGAVIVEREDVILAEPRQPDQNF